MDTVELGPFCCRAARIRSNRQQRMERACSSKRLLRQRFHRQWEIDRFVRRWRLILGLFWPGIGENGIENRGKGRMEWLMEANVP